jgi:hypothetical protein
MRSHTVFLTLSVCSTVVISSALIARGGPLTPPAPGGGGAIQPTYKTLTEVEPRTLVNAANTPGDADSVYKITHPGSYYLGARITAAPFKHGIEIAASNVTLDLAGFSLTGGADSLNAIEVSAGFPLNIAIHDGLIESWQGNGIDAPHSVGISIRNIAVTFNTGPGFNLGNGSTIVDCSVTLSQGGFIIGDSAIVQRCRAEQIFNAGGFLLGESSRVSDSSAIGCSGRGFDVGFDSALTGCIADGNGSYGIAASRAVIASCTANGNAFDGITAGSHSVVTACTASNNGSTGISGSGYSIIESCTTRGNDSGGVLVVEGCIVRDNNISGENLSNPGTGIKATGTGNHIEGNLVQYYFYAFEAANQENLFVRNHARQNTQNYAQIASGNYVATIVTTSGAMNAATNANVNWSF